MTTWHPDDLTQLRAMLLRAKPGDVIECPVKTLRPRKPIVVPAGIIVKQPGSLSLIDESGGAYVED